jgi:hypothetical protein
LHCNTGSSVHSWITDYTESSIKGTAHLPTKDIHQWSKAETVAAHPLMTYRMIRRFSHSMKHIVRNINDTVIEKSTRIFNFKLIRRLQRNALNIILIEMRSIFPGLLKKMKLYEQEFILPNKTDLENMMENILRIQHVYDLDAGGVVITFYFQCSMNM